MPPKTLSNGLLSLKFMQRKATTSKDEKTQVVELVKAKVNDDAEWDVGRDVREAWGLTGPSSSTANAEVVYESSYIPFLYGQDSDDAVEDKMEESSTAPRRRGRWSTLKVEEPKQDSQGNSARSEEDEEETKPEPKPFPVNSKFRGGISGGLARAPPKEQKPQKRKRGDDDTTTPQLNFKEETPSQRPPTFLRPAGVAAPSTQQAAAAGPSSESPKKKKKRKDKPDIKPDPNASRDASSISQRTKALSLTG